MVSTGNRFAKCATRSRVAQNPIHGVLARFSISYPGGDGRLAVLGIMYLQGMAPLHVCVSDLRRDFSAARNYPFQNKIHGRYLHTGTIWPRRTQKTSQLQARIG